MILNYNFTKKKQMKKVLYFLTTFFLFSTFAENASAQIKTVNDGTFIPITTHKRKPVPYQHVREADVLWSKIMWRKIILTEKSNQKLYYPTVVMQDRKSLIQLMMHGIDKTVFYPYKDDDDFEVSYTQEEIDVNLGAENDTMPVLDDEGEELYDAAGNPVTKIIPGERQWKQVTELLIKEMWFFDKQRSVMDVRVIALCPIRVSPQDPNDPNSIMVKKKVFWVLYQEARNLFATQAVYNGENQASTISFDDIFFKRQFEGYIEQTSNVYENRPINEYTSGVEVLLESEKVKTEVFDYEHNMWEF